ncbi:uncharacterized protein VP01_1213g1 [Puccinia sorghi]|uniref:HAT C-terminal dimerisation domain-containing protein n=1 Tax=Puccinia sorghi TaxID=27349 RepID=A0A0L6VQA1_9BASI|nr:uncharacterized protein VP01_1213g1 [Puccinia sorghi]
MNIKEVQKISSFFSSKLYNTADETNQEGLGHTGLSMYLKEDLEPEGHNLLKYWSIRQSKFPTLSIIAHIYLGIPATSAASKCLFSKGIQIIYWQQSSLNPWAVEELLFIKEWSQNGFKYMIGSPTINKNKAWHLKNNPPQKLLAGCLLASNIQELRKNIGPISLKNASAQ